MRSNNRKHSLPKGWFPPSIRATINNHIYLAQKICSILPISEIVIETAKFDIQRIKNPYISGSEYQQGNLNDFLNVREFVLYRDEYRCQNPKCNQKDKILNVHHIQSRKIGGNRPDNLITLCETCHKKLHKKKIQLDFPVKKGFGNEAFMDTIGKKLINEFRKNFSNVREEYGHNTKEMRKTHGLPKQHFVDARCIAGHPLAEPTTDIYHIKKLRSHNRKLHKCTIRKNGFRQPNQTSKKLFGFKVFDIVETMNQRGYISAKRTSGSFAVRTMDGSKYIAPGKTYKKFKLINHAGTHLISKYKYNTETIDLLNTY